MMKIVVIGIVSKRLWLVWQNSQTSGTGNKQLIFFNLNPTFDYVTKTACVSVRRHLAKSVIHVTTRKAKWSTFTSCESHQLPVVIAILAP